MNDPWAFGWTQVHTIVGFVITELLPSGDLVRSNDGESRNWKRRRSKWRWKCSPLRTDQSLCSSISEDRWRAVMNGLICSASA